MYSTRFGNNGEGDPVSLPIPKLDSYAKSQIAENTRQARDMSRQLLEEIAQCLKPGMTEQDAFQEAEAVFKRHPDVVKRWHRPHVHFGPHSITTAYDPLPTKPLTLQAEDIAYIDIGPVMNIQGNIVEGDAGATFVFGNNPLHHQLKQTVEDLFQDGVRYWRENRPTGIALYQHLKTQTEKAGFQFHLEPAGHLIGSFPHAQGGWTKGLNHFPNIPSEGLWILEVQIRHPQLPLGAFYEDLLI